VIRIRRLGPALIQHLEAYGHLAGCALHDLGSRARTRALRAAVGVALALAFVTLVGATLIAAGWGSPYRYWIATGVLLAMAGGAAGFLSSAFAMLTRSTHLQALKDEWQKDKDWLSSSRRDGAASGVATTSVAAFTAAGRNADPDRIRPGSRNRSATERA